MQKKGVSQFVRCLSIPLKPNSLVFRGQRNRLHKTRNGNNLLRRSEKHNNKSQEKKEEKTKRKKTKTKTDDI